MAFAAVAQSVDQIGTALQIVVRRWGGFTGGTLQRIPQRQTRANAEREVHLGLAIGDFHGRLGLQPDPQRIDVGARDVVVAGIRHGG